MSVQLRLNIDALGDKLLAEALRTLPQKMERSMLLASLRKGMQGILQASKAAVPAGYDRLRDSLKIVSMKPKRGSRGVRVVAGKRGDLGIEATKNPGSKGGKGRGFYPVHVELGYVAQNGRAIPPRPFLRGPLRSGADRTLGIVGSELWRRIREEWRKQGGKAT